MEFTLIPSEDKIVLKKDRLYITISHEGIYASALLISPLDQHQIPKIEGCEVETSETPTGTVLSIGCREASLRTIIDVLKKMIEIYSSDLNKMTVIYSS